MTEKHQNKRLVTLDFAKPVPNRRIGLAWRRGFIRPQAVVTVADAIRSLKIPGLKMLAEESMHE